MCMMAGRSLLGPENKDIQSEKRQIAKVGLYLFGAGHEVSAQFARHHFNSSFLLPPSSFLQPLPSVMNLHIFASSPETNRDIATSVKKAMKMNMPNTNFDQVVESLLTDISTKKIVLVT